MGKRLASRGKRIQSKEVSKMIAIIHKKCGAVAFYYDYFLKSGDKIKSECAKTPSGDLIPRGSTMICGFCHESTPLSSLRQMELGDGS
jgi:hypothetical protein